MTEPNLNHQADMNSGNAGVEAAVSMANPKLKNKVQLLARGPTMDRCNEENQNIILKMQEKGQIQILFNSTVQEIHEDHLVLSIEGKTQKTPNDFLFVFAGAEVPFKFLMSLGIVIDKKFGDGLKKTS